VYRIAVAIAREILSDIRSLHHAILSLIFRVHTSESMLNASFLLESLREIKGEGVS